MKTKFFNLIILDESGSMSCMHQQTINGCNETINTIRAAQKKFGEQQEHYVSIFAFQSDGERESRYLIKNVPVAEVEHVTANDYEPYGCTPLYDAVGATLTDLKRKVDKEASAIGSVTIITDGEENSSRRYTGSQVAEMIASLKSKGWNFNFIGANIDVQRAAKELNIDNYLAFEQTEEKVDAMFEIERNSRMNYYDRANTVILDCVADPDILECRLREASADYFEKPQPTERVAPNHIRHLNPGEIFVFGSNLAGQHMGGAARAAHRYYGAIMGQGIGLQGQSYAIPTMQGGVETIQPYVDEFIHFAMAHPELKFLVTRIGCGIAGFRVEEIAPLFKKAENVGNIYLPEDFWDVLKSRDANIDF